MRLLKRDQRYKMSQTNFVAEEYNRIEKYTIVVKEQTGSSRRHNERM